MSEFLVTGTAILTDQIFTDYGGQTGTSTPAQRQVAYQIAEQFAVEEIGTFLVPTTITGTFPWPLTTSRIHLPHDRLRRIDSVLFIHEAGCNCASGSVDIVGCAWVIDEDNGLIDVRECGSAVCHGCACVGHGHGGLLQIRVAYTAGAAPGLVAANGSALMGLVTAADLALQQIIDPAGAEGGPGDPQVKSFSDTGYSETREGLRMTAFGGSPRANLAARMLAPLKFKGALKL